MDELQHLFPNAEQFDELIKATDRRPTKEQFDQATTPLDGTEATYRAAMHQWFTGRGALNASPKELTALCDEWYELTRPRWHGWTSFYDPATSEVSTGTKGGDNADLTCKASTDTVAGQDDYAGNPFFVPTDVNWTVDPDTKEPIITQIAGITPGFERHNPDKLVGVMQMGGYMYVSKMDTTELTGYSSTPDIPVQGLVCEPGACRPDGSHRPWRLGAKYPNATINGKPTSCAGHIPTAWMSHNTMQTLAKILGTQYSGMTTADDTWLILMARIKYASLTMDGIINGCCSNNWQYPAAVSETGVRRVLVTTAQGANIEKGMGVLIGNTAGNADRGQAAMYSITTNTGAIVTKVENVSVGEAQYTAVYVDTPETFDTTTGPNTTTAGTTVISSFHWPTGSCDGVKGNDGSPKNCTSGKYPAKLQGIEYMLGGYEVFNDVIIVLSGSEADGYGYEPHIVADSSKQSTKITADYKATGVVCAQDGAAAWKYIKHLGFANGVFFPDMLGGSTTTFTRDAMYQSAGATYAEREWLAFAGLDAGAIAGLAALRAGSGLGTGYWDLLARLSPNGNRGELSA